MAYAMWDTLFRVNRYGVRPQFGSAMHANVTGILLPTVYSLSCKLMTLWLTYRQKMIDD